MAFQYFGKSTPIEKGDKTVSTYSSGLCLVQQSYVIRKIDEEIYRNEFASGSTLDIVSPAVDGLYIFPEPQWRDSGNGFMEIAISAYGRSNTIGKTEISAILRNVQLNLRNVTSDIVSVERTNAIVSYLKLKVVVQSGTFPEINVSDLRDLIIIRNSDGSDLELAGYTTSVYFNLAITRYDITNFGYWDELTITIEPEPVIITRKVI
jgi:hypothetical protein